MQEFNCCIRCGQPFSLDEDNWAEDKSVNWGNVGEYCPRCYMDLVEMNQKNRY